jgi:predicted GIY-YIG superfamily endonuclease
LPSEARWFVYILRCRDGTLYTGVTTDVARRVAAHAAGRGARYTRGRGPFAVVRVETHPGRGAALRREVELKRLARAEKLLLVRGKGLRSARGA